MLAGVLDNRDGAFFNQEVAAALLEGDELFEVEIFAFGFLAFAVAFAVALSLFISRTRGSAKDRLLFDFRNRRQLGGLAAKDNGAFELAAVLLKVVQSLGIYDHHIAFDLAVGSRRPAESRQSQSAAIIGIQDLAVGGAAFPALR